MTEITLRKPRDRNEDVCARCGIPRFIGCHHDRKGPPDCFGEYDLDSKACQYCSVRDDCLENRKEA